MRTRTLRHQPRTVVLQLIFDTSPCLHDDLEHHGKFQLSENVFLPLFGRTSKVSVPTGETCEFFAWYVVLVLNVYDRAWDQFYVCRAGHFPHDLWGILEALNYSNIFIWLYYAAARRQRYIPWLVSIQETRLLIFQVEMSFEKIWDILEDLKHSNDFIWSYHAAARQYSVSSQCYTRSKRVVSLPGTLQFFARPMTMNHWDIQLKYEAILQRSRYGFDLLLPHAADLRAI